MKNIYQNSTLNKSKRKNSALGMSIVFLVILLASDIYGQKTIEIPMRDGIKLATDLYFPKSENGPFPVILMRTPYNKEILKGCSLFLFFLILFCFTFLGPISQNPDIE